MRDGSSIQFDEDISLMLKVKRGDHQAYARLYEKYVPVVREYIARRNGRAHCQDDLVQEVFARVWSHRSQYRPLAPVRRYLLGISANVLREDRARTRGQVPLDVRQFEGVVDTNLPSPLAHAQSAEELEVLRALIAGLPTGQRQAIELVYLAGLPRDEAIRQVGCSPNALRKGLSRACRKLRRLVRPSE